MRTVAWLALVVLISAASASSCDDASSDVADAGTDLQTDGSTPPVIDELTIIENPASVLSALVVIETDVATYASVVVEDVSTEETFVVGPTETADDEHEIEVIGLRAETDYALTVTVEDTSGNTASSEPQTHTTSPLPDGFPPIQVLVSEPDEMAPGYTIVGINRWNPGLDQGWGYLVMLDSAGEPVWYLYTGLPTLELQALPNGHILYIFGLHGALEVDLYGNQYNFWLARSIGLDSMHHDISPIEDGNYVALSTEMREVAGYPVEGGGTTSHFVVGDIIAEIDRDGTILRDWSLFDYYDPLVVPYGFDDPFYDMIYAGGGISTTKDWTHSNTVLLDPTDGNYLISIRHLDRIIKLDRETDEIVWEFGEGGDFMMDGDGEWQFHQHSPVLQDDGHLLVYDNGNNRSTLGTDETPFTRVVEFELDTSNSQDLRARQVWEYRGQEAYFAPYLGDVKRLSNGNVLVTDGGILADPSHSESQPDARRWGHIAEVTYDTPAEVVFEVEIRDLSETPVGYSLFRSERIPSLYP